MLIYRSIKVAYSCNDRFGMLLATGIGSMLCFEVLVNAGMTMGIMPVTGIPLPFISYGVSALTTNMISVGILLNISMQRKNIFFSYHSNLGMSLKEVFHKRRRMYDSIRYVMVTTCPKPARYTGGEYNSIVKDHSTVDITMALGFPDVYEVAMSHLGIKILYGLVNRREDAVAERVFAPWHDMEEEMRKRNIPLFSLETRTPIKDFDVLAFTLQYEMSFTNILNMLDLAGIPMYAKDRDMDFPLLVCGGPCAYNVEPIADFFDIVSLGESEEWGDEFIDLLKAEKAKGFPGGKEAFLRKAAQIPGTYCPALYDVEYTEQGDFKSITPRFEDVPTTIQNASYRRCRTCIFPYKTGGTVFGYRS